MISCLDNPIVFLDNPGYINIIKDTYPKKDLIVLNLNSMYSNIAQDSIYNLSINISNLNTTGLLTKEYVDTVNFDIDYANYLMNQPLAFESLMKIIINTYYNKLVIILVYRDQYRDSIMESLIKFIQQKYGYKCFIIEDISDIESLEESVLEEYHLLNIKNDIIKYRDMYFKGLVNSNIIDFTNLEMKIN